MDKLKGKKISLKTLSGTIVIAASLTIELFGGAVFKTDSKETTTYYDDYATIQTDINNDEIAHIELSSQEFALVKDIIGNYTIVFGGGLPSAMRAVDITNKIKEENPELQGVKFSYETSDRFDVKYKTVITKGKITKLDYGQYMIAKDSNGEYYVIKDDININDNQIEGLIKHIDAESKIKNYKIVSSNEIDMSSVEIINEGYISQQVLEEYRTIKYDDSIELQKNIEDNLESTTISENEFALVKDNKGNYILVFGGELPSAIYARGIMNDLKEENPELVNISFEYDTAANVNSQNPNYEIILKGQKTKLDYSEYVFIKSEDGKSHLVIDDKNINEDKINGILNNVFEKNPELDGINYDITTSDKVDIDKSEIITRGYARGEKPKHDNTKDVLSTIGVISGAGLIASSIIEKQKQEEQGRHR